MTTAPPPAPSPLPVFGDVLAEAVDLLRSLPRRRPGVPAARQAVERWRAAHPGTHAQLVTDVRPGSPIVDHDLVLSHPGGGSVALTAPADDGVPWTVDHSTHWASGVVLMVDDQELLIQNALLTLRARAAREPAIQQELIDYCILDGLVEREPDPTPAELQEASDAYRLRRGLLSRAEMLRWLEEVGLTRAAYDNHVYGLALRRRLRSRVERETAEDHVRRHRADFDRVSAVWVTGPEDRLAALASCDDPLAALARALLTPAQGGELAVTVAERVARELPVPLRDTAEGGVVGPVAHGRDHLFGVVRERRPADPTDPDTLAAAGRAGFAAFMAERRAKAAITWYWL
ncbi:putative peptide maturation system protein [Nonomuraea solani]|uniref:Putative peptide maturation system protein n=1 Tax=Nonomuraea solani TaxID=1144553 RepID=A0A1H6F0J5_9ACTN|nr:TIGR04500 family putative peptide maturation system protein [Nonomuraea solani]SEH03667.1 putative peptide maturation system protein [Nonomuraea solani]